MRLFNLDFINSNRMKIQVLSYTATYQVLNSLMWLANTTFNYAEYNFSIVVQTFEQHYYR